MTLARCFIFIVVMTAMVGVSAGATPVPRAVFALIVGENRCHDAKRLPLRFADDDALQYGMLMRQLTPSERVVVLTTPDDETRTIHPEAHVRPPTRKRFFETMAAINRAMNDARKSGSSPILYLFYTGHGDVRNNEGYVTLADGVLTRTDLLSLLRKSRAAQTHLIIDACKSYYMVFNRGVGGKRGPLTGPLVIADDGLPPNTGVLLSTSSDSDSHEWEAYQGGIFSHEVRSAMRGAADANNDRKISYEEAAAFIWNANQGIAIHRFRPRFFVRAPNSGGLGEAVLADLSAANGDWLSMRGAAEARRYIEDGKGRRLSDLHVRPQTDIALLLPRERPLFVRSPDTAEETRLPPGDHLSLSHLSVVPVSVTVRGAAHDAFDDLFVNPYDSETISAYHRSLEMAVPPHAAAPKPPNHWPRWSMGIGAIVFGTAALAIGAAAVTKYLRVDSSATGVERRQINQELKALSIATYVCLGVASVATISYLVWTVKSKSSPKFQLTISPALTTLGGTF